MYISWCVTIDGELAMDDFDSPCDQVTFEAGITQQVNTIMCLLYVTTHTYIYIYINTYTHILQFLVLQATNESVPELSETYSVTLTSVTVDDIYPSTTPTSGAWLNDSLTIINITVSENDDPYGIIQFAESAPIDGDLTIPPAVDILQVYVEEALGDVTVYVVRAQGTAGVAQVEYATEDGTAVSGINPDYVPTAGELNFADGDRVKSFTVQLFDDDTPELGKYFFVNLSMPSGSEYMYIHTYIHTYVHKHTYIHMYVRTYICTYVRTYIHTLLMSLFLRFRLISQTGYW